MSDIYDVTVEWSGNMRGTSTYTVIADSEEEAAQLADSRDGELISMTIIRDDTEITDVTNVKYIQEY